MFLWNRHLDRRTFLRGMGATVALPLLDAMTPARTLFASARPIPRLAFVYFPHGAIMDEWTRVSVPVAPAAAAGRVVSGLELGRILEPLAPFRHRLTVVSGLENRHACGPVHAITPGTWLSGTSAPRRRGGPSAPARGEVSPKLASDADASEGVTADQLAADYLGRDAPLPSLAIAAEEPKPIGAGIWQGEYDESYGTTISFRQAQSPVAMEFRPRAVFDSLFRSTAPRTVRAGTATDRREQDTPAPASILDLVAADAARLRQRLGPADRAVLGEYLEQVRDVERRADTVPLGDGPFKERLALMFDMIALAFRADITRVASVMMAAEASAMTYDHLGVPDSFHLLSHHQNDAEKIARLVRIQTFHTQMFAAFVRTLSQLPDGDGSLLDRSLILFGSNMSNSYAHDHFPLPLAVVGGGCGALRGGQHLRYPDRTPLSNLLLTLLHRAGVPADSVGDSTCECAEL